MFIGHPRRVNLGLPSLETRVQLFSQNPIETLEQVGMMLLIAVLSLLFSVKSTGGTTGLYGLSSPFIQLSKFDPKTGDPTVIGPEYSGPWSVKVASISSKSNLFYSLCVDRSTHSVYLYALDLDTGKLVLNVTTPLGEGAFLGMDQGIHVDENEMKVYIIGVGIHGWQVILEYDEVKKTITQIGDTGQYGWTLSGGSAYDTENQKLYIVYAKQGMMNLAIFDIKTKTFSTPIKDVEKLETLEYDEVTGLIYGIGLTQNETMRTLVSYDGVDKFEIIRTYPDYFIMDSILSGIDTQNGEYFAMLQKKSGNSGGFDLVTLDLKTGDIQNHPECTSGKCPYCMTFKN